MTAGDATACAYCGLLRIQDTGVEPGAYNDNGFWCADCIMRGRKRTKAQDEWAAFARDYPQFATELLRLRKQYPQ